MEKLSASLEDYLEVIYNSIKYNESVKAVDIARELNVSRASVTEALNKLADKGLINYGRYQTITITDMGMKIAQDVVNRHSSLSSFFENVLGASRQEAEENACRIEHIISAELLDRIEVYVKFADASPEVAGEFKKFYLENLNK
ncbi:MAG: metal-dependent transcriptional regulator [Fusobacterium sp.]|nr:metal-dependent transcriptional regulator [Fusobacterium sp.]